MNVLHVANYTRFMSYSGASPEFCRNGVFKLTTEYNNGALECNCNVQGSLSLKCDQFGGQCRCRSNVIGRDCSACRTGYYGFPNCKRKCFVTLQYTYI